MQCFRKLPMPLIENKIKTATIILGVVFIAFWVSQGYYQSHYLSALRLLGDYKTKNVLGDPKEGRGDEWSTYLPILKQSYLEGFPKKSSLEPYKEEFNWPIAIPKFDISLFFLPNYIVYWILPGSNSLSIQGLYYNILLLFSIFLLLKNLGVKPIVAFTSGLMILFSHFYQVWWTSNVPALGASILPLAIYTSNLSSRIKFPVLFWSICHVLFGQIYPPFYISLAICLLPLLLAVRTDLLCIKNVLFSIATTSLALLVFIFSRWDYISAVSNTSYPGMRFSTGGDVNVRLLLSIILPSFPVSESSLIADSATALSSVGTILPLIFLSQLPFIKWDRFSKRVTIITFAMLAFVTIYMIAGFPAWLSKISLFYLVPGLRMIIGVSLLITFYCAIMISHHWQHLKITSVLFASLIFSLILYSSGPRLDIIKEFYLIKWYWLMPLFFSLLGTFLYYFSSNKIIAKNISIYTVLWGISIFHVISFGSFNPIIKAEHILVPVDTQVTRDIRKLIEFADAKPLSIIGNYGHVLRGEGLPVYNAIHLVNVDKNIYFNHLKIQEHEWDKQLNLFRGISFGNVESTNYEGATIIFPADIGGLPFVHQIVHVNADHTSLANEIHISEINLVDTGFRIHWSASLINDQAISKEFNIYIPCEVTQSWLTRYPVSDGSSDLLDYKLAKLAGAINIVAESESAAIGCVRQMIIGNG